VTFGEPERLALLAVPAVLLLLVAWRHHRRLRQQRGLASPAVWSRLMGGTPATGLWRMVLWCAAGAVLVLALARPQWGEVERERSIRTRDLVVAVDVSDSMRCPDLEPTRLGAVLRTLERALPLLDGNRVGVVVFAGEAYALVPLTTDLDAVAVFLETVEPGIVALPGSNLQRAVATALDMLPADGEGRVVVLATDGENLQGEPAAAAEALSDAGVGMVALVAGTEAGGPIPIFGPDGGVAYKRGPDGQPVVTRARPEVLAELAQGVDGELVRLDEDQPQRAVAAAIERLRTREAEADRSVQKIERFPSFLWVAAALLVVGFGLSPWRRRVAAAALLLVVAAGPATAQQTDAAGPPPRAPAGVDLDDGPVAWWQRWIPGGSRRLAHEGLDRWRADDPEGAAEAFAGAAELDPEDPVRAYDLGTAVAATGGLEVAAPLLERAYREGVAGAAYNAGTAALDAGQPGPAVQWLREALLAEPDNADVKRNYELALRMLEQQQQQQQEQQQPQESEQQDSDQPSPTPTPQPEPQGAPPTPTPDSTSGLFQALDNAEAQAREAMRTPTPAQPPKVEKDW